MALKTFDTRIRNKRDEYQNWVSANPVLLSGEICVVVVPADATKVDATGTAATGKAVEQQPCILMKVGDGTSQWSALPWVSALSADIYSWAKEPTKPAYKAEEIEGIADYISGRVQDTNTTYKLEQDTEDPHKIVLSSKEVGAETWTQVAEITTADTVYDDTGLVAQLQEHADILVTHSEDIDHHFTMITDLIGEDWKDADAQLPMDVRAIAGAVLAESGYDVILGEHSEALVEHGGLIEEQGILLTEHGELLTVCNDNLNALIGDDINPENDHLPFSVREIAADELAKQLIPENATEALDTLQEISAWIQGHPDEAATMNADITTLKKQLKDISEAEGAVKKYVDDAIAALSIGDYAKAADLLALAGRVEAVEGVAHSHANEAVLNNIDEDRVALWDTAEANANSFTEEAIGNFSDTLHAVATSGDIVDLAQSGTIVFYCGTAAEVMDAEA